MSKISLERTFSADYSPCDYIYCIYCVYTKHCKNCSYFSSRYYRKSCKHKSKKHCPRVSHENLLLVVKIKKWYKYSYKNS